MNRSLRPDVRNPLLSLPEFAECRALLHGTEPIEPRKFAKLFDRALLAAARQCREKAQTSWRQNKGPMACYHKVTGAMIGHTARALR